VLLDVDYSQIELRILAHFSGDENLLNSFQFDHQDVFRQIASRWLKKAENDISDTERNSVKQLCYANIYGSGAQLVADNAGISVPLAAQWMKDFIKAYPGIKNFMDVVKADCAKNNFVTTLLGRKRYISNISSSDYKLRSRAERQAVNTVCQGSAADLIKVI
jgi:DNA polymerase theta